jgi:hypothetical protein
VAVISTLVGDSLTLNLERKLIPSRPSMPFPNESASRDRCGDAERHHLPSTD